MAPPRSYRHVAVANALSAAYQRRAGISGANVSKQ